MIKPPLGYYLPCRWVYNRDGDTVTVKLRTGQEVAVRLTDINAAEKNTDKGLAAKHWLDALLEQNIEPVSVYLTLIRDQNYNEVIDVTDVLNSATFDRWPGRVFVGEEDLNDLIVRAGHAKEV